MDPKKRSVGIDLGTTNSEIYTYINNHAAVVPGPNGLTITPSRVVVDNKSTPEDIKYAVRARRHNVLRDNPENEIYEPKRVIGRKMEDGYIRVDLHYWPFDLVPGDDDKPMYRVAGANQSHVLLSAVDVDAEILRTLKSYSKEGITNAVITIPSYFNKDQEEETRQAGIQAGLNVLKCIHEPVAAAIAYGFTNNVKNADVLVYDLGGGTFDCCVVRIVGGKYHIMASDGHSHLGGADFDNAIVKMVADELRETEDIDVYASKKDLRNLKDLAEKAKIALSGALSYTLQYKCTNTITQKVVGYNHMLMRADFEGLIKRYIDITIEYIDRCLQQLGMTEANIDYVIPVGGSTRIPYVHARLEERFKRSIDTTKVNIDEAVAAGAAIEANAIMEGESLIEQLNPTSDSNKSNVNDPDPMDAMMAIPANIYYSVGNGYNSLFNMGRPFRPNSNGEHITRSNRNVNPPRDYMNSVPFEFYYNIGNGKMEYLGCTKIDITEPDKAESIVMTLRADLTNKGRLSIVISNKKDNSTADVSLRVRNDTLDNIDMVRARNLKDLKQKCKNKLLELVQSLSNTEEIRERRKSLIAMIRELEEDGEYYDDSDLTVKKDECAELLK